MHLVSCPLQIKPYHLSDAGFIFYDKDLYLIHDAIILQSGEVSCYNILKLQKGTLYNNVKTLDKVAHFSL